jgi:mannose-6-phosphate isomerase-like protein (cupin superfamily)
MKRVIPFGLICVAAGFLGGYVTSQRSVVIAQGGDSYKRSGLGPGPAASRFQDGKAYVILRDDVLKKFPPADKAGKVAEGGPSSNLGWDPVYSLVVMRRPYMDPPQKLASTGELSHWAGAEMHEMKAQLYIIMNGTGQVTLGGKPAKERMDLITNGQHGGGDLGPAQGATATKVKPGDMVVIPTFAWHQIQADPGQTFNYIKVDIAEPRLMP